LIIESPDGVLRRKLEVLTEIRDRAVEIGLATSKTRLRESSARVAMPAMSVMSAMRRAAFRPADIHWHIQVVQEAIESAGSEGMLLAVSEVELAAWREEDFRYYERLVQVHQELVACLTSIEMELRRRVMPPQLA